MIPLPRAVSGDYERSKNTVKALLAHRIQQRHIVTVRPRRLFAAIPVGADSETYPINIYLITSYAVPDAVIAYHSAFFQVAYSASYCFNI